MLTLTNGSRNPLKVLSHVEARERHYDWFTIKLAAASETRLLRLYDEREESGRVIVELNPGQSLEHRIDVVAWARRAPNGAGLLRQDAIACRRP